jgi:hypothetical protein
MYIKIRNNVTFAKAVSKAVRAVEDSTIAMNCKYLL